MRFLQVFIFVFLIFVGSFSPAYAQEEGGNISVRLLAERGVVGAGDEIWVAIEQSIRPNWHTYWKNPGDSGTPMRIKWDFPAGFEVGEIQWPAPHKIEYAPLLNYGYEDSVILLQKLKTPAEMPVGAVTLTASYEVLVCEEECVPAYGEEVLVLNGPQALDEDNGAYIAKALSKIPAAYAQGGQYYEKGEDFVLEFPVLDGALQGVDWSKVAFVPEEWGVIDNVAKVSVSVEAARVVISQKRGDRDLAALDDLRVVVLLGDRAVVVEAQKGKGRQEVVASASVSAQGDISVRGGLFRALFFAVLGGLVLNLMPCVFPVLSIKALSLVKMSEKNVWTARGHGLAYTAGVVLSFLVISGVLIALKGAGEEIGWGFQLQNPVVVAVLVYLLFIIGLNLAGFFEFTSRFSNVGGKLTHVQGIGGSFFTGILATLVAAPCTAPFMGAAISFALGHSAVVGLGVFAALGVGLALPYLVLSFVPVLRHLLPKPGAWMDVFKQFLAFPMFASAAWLFWVLSLQVGSMGILGAAFGLVLIGFGIWLFKVAPRGGMARIVVIVLGMLAFAGAVSVLPVGDNVPQGKAGEYQQDGIMTHVYSERALEVALASDDPVFVEMTAAWCITCKVNHRSSIDIERTRGIFAARKVRYLVGDWTNQDAGITKYLHLYGRNGVPIYVYYGRPDAAGKRPEAIVLPQILTPGIVANYLDQ